jgi:hypothetical protein
MARPKRSPAAYQDEAGFSPASVTLDAMAVAPDYVTQNRGRRIMSVEPWAPGRRADGAVPEPIREPNGAPARELRELLAEDRDDPRLSDWTFEDAWTDDVAFVLARITNTNLRTDWRRIFAETKPDWQAGWDRRPALAAVANVASGDDLQPARHSGPRATRATLLC